MLDKRTGIGGNSPPDQIGITRLVYQELSAWLLANPAVNELNAKHCAELIKRARIAAQELDEERDSKVRPLNTQVKEINKSYKLVSEPLDNITLQIKARLATHVRAEEARREAEAMLASMEAEAAAIKAQETAEAEREAIENAELGEIGVDVGGAIQDAAQAKADAERAARAAAIAEKDITVRVSTGFGKAIGMRTVETLIVRDLQAAVRAMSGNVKIIEATISAARDYRKTHKVLPTGVMAGTERKI